MPENTAAFIFSESGIENVITEPGGYEYRDGEKSVLAGDGIGSLFSSVASRFTFGGSRWRRSMWRSSTCVRSAAFKFGTPAPLVYNDKFYGVDLEIRARGTMSLKVTDPVRFVRNYVPANVTSYAFDNPKAREQILSEFVQSFIVAINRCPISIEFRRLPAHANDYRHSACAR